MSSTVEDFITSTLIEITSYIINPRDISDICSKLKYHIALTPTLIQKYGVLLPAISRLEKVSGIHDQAKEIRELYLEIIRHNIDITCKDISALKSITDVTLSWLSLYFPKGKERTRTFRKGYISVLTVSLALGIILGGVYSLCRK